MKKPVEKENIIYQDFESILSDEFMRYTYYVMEDRAIPDARDGLKPSQRRILYAMHKLGLKNNGSTEKCAKVVGTTTGDYHPHGDIVTYPTLVRMAQDWIMRYPLIHPQGNFGSIDPSSGAAAQRYCVAGSSLVLTTKGIIKIADIGKDGSDEQDINIKIVSRQNCINEADKWFNSGVHPIKNITTQAGYNIQCSYNHPLLIIEENETMPKLTWKLAEDIKQGDCLVLSRGNNIWSKTKFSTKKYFPAKNKNSRIYTAADLPLKIDEHMGFLMGAITSEGYIASKQDRFGFVNVDENFIQEFLSTFYKTFPNLHLQKKLRHPHKKFVGRKSYYSCECKCKIASEFLCNLGINSTGAANKSIPFSILQSPKKVMSSFLKALFEGDGSVVVGNMCVSYCSASKELIDQLKIVLLNYGIFSFFTIDKRNNVNYKLEIYGIDNLKIFKREIGFFSKEKKEKLDYIISQFKNNKRRTASLSKTQFVPHVSKFIRKNAIHNQQTLKNNNLDRYINIRNYHHLIKHSLKKDDFDKISEIIGNNYVYSFVKTIENKEPENVYSIRVDSSCHSFIANGFVNHNTECKLSQTGDLMVQDISSDIVPHTLNYNEKLLEPLVLTSCVPNLLLNGCSGIAVGVATKVASHNYRELVEVIKAYIKNPKITVDEIMKLMPGPDFATGGVLLGSDGVRSYYETGKGSLLLEGKYEIVDGNCPKIIIKEFPFGGSPEEFLLQTENLIKEKKIDGIIDLKDLSNRKNNSLNIHVVVEINKPSSVKVVLNQLLKQTCLRTNFSVNHTVLFERTLLENVSLKQLIQFFIDHRTIVLKNKYQIELQKTDERIHILDGFISVHKNINKVVNIIVNAENIEEAQNSLIVNNYVKTEEQARAVLSITLRQLTKLEANSLIQEQNKLQTRKNWLDDVLSSDKKIIKLIIKEQEEQVKLIGDERRTIIKEEVEQIKSDDLIPKEEAVIILTHDGYIKRMPLSVYNNNGADNREINKIIFTNTHENALFFTDFGMFYKKMIYEIPSVNLKTNKGVHISGVLSLSQGEKVLQLFSSSELDKNKYILLSTISGMIKKTEIFEYDTKLKNKGTASIKLRTGDKVCSVDLTSGENDILILTATGKAISYNEDQISPTGKFTIGVKALNLQKSDKIVKLLMLEKNTNRQVLVMTEMGFSKVINSLDYLLSEKKQVKGKDTISKIKFDRNGYIVDAYVINNKNLCVLTEQNNFIELSLDVIKKINNRIMGVQIVQPQDGDKIQKIFLN